MTNQEQEQEQKQRQQLQQQQQSQGEEEERSPSVLESQSEKAEALLPEGSTGSVAVGAVQVQVPVQASRNKMEESQSNGVVGAHHVSSCTRTCTGTLDQQDAKQVKEDFEEVGAGTDTDCGSDNDDADEDAYLKDADQRAQDMEAKLRENQTPDARLKIVENYAKKSSSVTKFAPDGATCCTSCDNDKETVETVGAHRVSVNPPQENHQVELEEDGVPLPPPTTLQRDRTLFPIPPSTPGAHFGRAVSAPFPLTEQPTTPPPPLRNAASMDFSLFGDLPFLEATLVEEQNKSTSFDLRASARRRVSGLLMVHATPLHEQQKLHNCCCSCWTNKESKWKLIGTFLVLLVLALGLGLGLGLGLSNHNNANKNYPPTLQQVRDRGVLKCGVGSYSPGLHFVDENGTRSGFDVALCHAIAAAVLGPDHAQVEFHIFPIKSRFRSLGEHQVDVIAGGTTHTMERDIWEPNTQTGFSFSSPYLYEGLQLAGDPHSVGCTENNFKNTEECAIIMICVIEGTSHHAVLSSKLPGRQLFVVDTYETMVQAFVDRDCSLMAHEGHQLQEASIRDLGYRGGYRIGDQTLSKEPLCLVSRKEDTQWTSFVNLVLQGLLLAEQHNITQAMAQNLPQTLAFGDTYKDMFRHSLAVAGNYGELYMQYLEPVVPRKKVNHLNDGSGLLYSHPLGNVDNDGNAAVGSYLEHLQQQGKVRCGIIPKRPGFAAVPPGGYSYQGMEIDLCKALSAALFAGFATEIELVPVQDEEEGYASLAEGLVDVLAGATWDFRAFTSDNHLSFSPPYFYNDAATNRQQENLCLATSARHGDWSSFVYWIVMGIIKAEEDFISQDDSNAMPEVNVFGEDYSRMFRDTILAVGNYGELYNRRLQEYYPRQGRNVLNSGFNPGPQHYTLPGLM